MLRAYMDDSGSHYTSHNCVVGGYWGGVNHWRKFERAWNRIVVSEGIREFKARTFWRRSRGKRVPPYAGWSDERANHFLDQLLGVIEETKVFPFAAGVLGGDWTALAPYKTQVMTANEMPRLQKSLFLPFQRSILRALGYCYRGVPMNFVFDENSDILLKQAMHSCFDRLKKQLKEEKDPLYESMGDLTFDGSEKAAPLQAADLIAYQAHQYAREANGNENHPIQAPYRRAISRFRTKDDFWLYDGRRFAELDSSIEVSRTLKVNLGNVQQQ